MNRRFWIFLILGLSVICISSSVFAAGSESSGLKDQTYFFGAVSVASAFGMAIASGVCGLAQGRAIAQAMDGIARQPSSHKDIQTSLIIGLALIESLALYTLVVILILIFASPFTGYITGA